MKGSRNNSPTLSLSQLQAGFEFPPRDLKLTKSVISKYLQATDGPGNFLKSGLVPPLILAACANTALCQSLATPPGTIHASQDFEFLDTVAIGDTVRCHGIVSQRLERGRLNLIVLEISIVNRDGEKVLTGKATLTLPN